MKRGLYRLYAIGFIGILLAANIPEVKQLLEDHARIIAPQVSSIAKLTYENLSTAISPIAGAILKQPQILLNGQVVDVDTKEDFSLSHGQSLTIEQIDQILKELKSPAYGTGPKWIQSGIKWNIDAAYPLYIFIHESNAATNTGWAGFKPNGTHTYNIGNMICAGYDPDNNKELNCYNGFRDYSWSNDPWGEGIDDNVHNLRLYRDGGIKDFAQAIAKWAPPSENRTQDYIDQGETVIAGWRNINKVALAGAQAVSAPITEDISDAFGFNVKTALDNNNKALRHITIKDGEQWSFNQSIGEVKVKLKYIYNIEGAGWCDLACRYVQVFKGLGLRIKHVPLGYSTDLPKDGQIIFIQHGGIALNQCTYDESPYIWTNDWKGGFHGGAQDLIINNDTGKTIIIAVIDNNDGTAIVQGKLE